MSTKESQLAPPHSLESEQALLGGILLNNDCYFRVSDYLIANHFFEPGHQRLYQTLETRINAGHLVTPGTIRGFLPAELKIRGTGLEQYLRVLAGQAGTIITAGEYGKIIRDLSVRRDLINIADEIRRDAFRADPDDGPERQLDEAQRKIAELLHSGSGGSANFKLLSKRQFTADFMPPDYVIDGVIQRRFIYSLTAATGQGKTAVALLISRLMTSAAPHPMLGPHAVERGKVLYLAGENPDDLRMRVIADDANSGVVNIKDDLFFIAGTFDIEQMFAKVKAHAEKICGVDLIVVDTSAAYFLSDDENNNPQMGAHARMLRRLTTLPGGPCVLVLCHPTKNAQEQAQLSPRGGGAFLAEMDGNLTLTRKDHGHIELWHTKMRGPGFEPITFRLEKIHCDKLVDTKGRRIATVRAVPMTAVEEEASFASSRRDEDRLLVAMLTPDRSIRDLAKSCGWTSDKGQPQTSKVDRLLKTLHSANLVKKNRGTWELTQDGKNAAEKAADAACRAAA